MIDRVPEELWTEVCDTVHEKRIKMILKKKKCKKAQWSSEEALQIAEKISKNQRRKGKMYTPECRVPKIARRDKKGFLSDQCKEIEENNKMGKTTDLFKKIKRYQGNISCKDGHDKG